ncbi:MAG: SMP-30/gluconolactonase/LRE family protein [Myxococcota bacterium]|jgi:sugar lactone lactonase YvrE
MRRLVPAVLGVLFGAGVYLGFGPTAIEPAAWQPPPPTPLAGPYAPNERLKDVEWWAKALVGPEAITFDAEGRLVTGLKDGRIVRLTPGSDDAVLLADTKGRPLAIAYHPDGRLFICDAHGGLLALAADGRLEVLATSEGGVPFKFADDLAIAKDGVVYFTDASARHSIEAFVDDLMEHQTTGRLLKYEPATKRVTKLADGFSFANGVALGPDEAYLVMSETGAYRLWRYWLKGEKAGQKEVFLDALPGFPDNVRYAPERHVFWVAIGSPRNPLIDRLAEWPGLRKAISRLPKAVQPAPERHAFVLAVDESGKPVESLQHRAEGSYSPIASAVERDGWLYFGSFAREGVARVRLPELPATPSPEAPPVEPLDPGG